MLHLLSYNLGSTRVNNDFTYSGKVCVTSMLTGEIEHTFSIPGSGNAVAFSPDARHVAVERDRGVVVYRVGSGKFVWQQPEANVGEVQFLNDETLLVATTKGELRVLATENGSEITQLTGYSRLDKNYKRPACFLSVASDKGLIAVGNELRVALWRYGVEPPTETLPASIAPRVPPLLPFQARLS